MKEGHYSAAAYRSKGGLLNPLDGILITELLSSDFAPCGFASGLL